MLLEIDPDLEAVAEFMQSNVAAAKLVATADALSAVAPLLWGRYERQGVQPLSLREPISGHDPHTQSGAT